MFNILKYPPIYQEALKELEKLVPVKKKEPEPVEDDEENFWRSLLHYNVEEKIDHEAVKTLAEKYWIPPHYLKLLKCDKDDNIGIGTTPKYFDHYCKNIYWNGFEEYQEICKKEISEVDEVFWLLRVPSEGLEKMFEIAKFYSTQPISKYMIEEYNTAVELRNELRENWNNLDEWFKTLSKFDNEDLIIANFEYRLSDINESFDKQLWKYYISFLKDNDWTIMMLRTYKCCTRLFIEDKELVEQYRAEIIEAAKNEYHVGGLVSDTILWEQQFGDIKNLKPFIENVVSNVTKKGFKLKKCSSEIFSNLVSNCAYQIDHLQRLRVELVEAESFFDEFAAPKILIAKRRCIEEEEERCIHPNFNEFLKQNFDLSGPIIHHILKNASPAVLQKLYQTCKYFYAKSKIPLCYRLILGDPEKSNDYKSRYYEQSLQFAEKDMYNERFFDLFKRIKIVNCLQLNLNSSRFFSAVIRNLNISSVKYICVTKRCGIFFDNLKYLFEKCPELKSLECPYVWFYDSNGKYMDDNTVKNFVKEHRPNLLFKF
uniref:Uncharacterized protein n=1 Tax=Panagrolaimus davidi TaxID=227884 RepID=A0A914PHA8_9BILA